MTAQHLPSDRTGDAARDEPRVRLFVENMAMFLADWGFPRMAARVLMVLMAADEERLTATELAERLEVSAAAISGAVRYLQQLGLVRRTPVAGSRSDAYEVPENSWYASAIIKGGLYQRLADLSDQGAQAAGAQGAGARRMTEMRDFFRFLDREVGRLLEQWETERGRG
ncbi:MarR family transcriptional regulator [Actinospica durhamensis]|uniref:MarR family transcriptional regulator n=1 Tax=Actinospica durhamensis TaxID=1508375 RepID=A0A941ESY7_9ACTN|nr:MarR family transcriptional regulator [Actinospica durhamensis]MBR7836633.1 MarR family transcriptional regulator [Actinospica durhamensis]